MGRYAPGAYARGAILHKGLKQNGLDSIVFLGTGALKYPKIVLRVLKNDYDCLIATGTLTFLFSRIFCRKPIVFDAFISNYDTLVCDRKTVKKGSFKARLAFMGDKYSCALSDAALFDTRQHLDYFVSEFGLERHKDKFSVIEVGADDETFRPGGEKTGGGPFRILFYGNYIPLHGVEYIIRAAKILEQEKDMAFELLGSGQTLAESKRLAQELGLRGISFGDARIDSDPQRYIGGADVCLGIFGDTGKALRVIPTKAFQIIAMGKPLITGDSPASRQVFTDKKNVILCKMANPQALADSILLLKRDAGLRARIAAGGLALYKERYTPKSLGGKLKVILNNLKV